MCEYVRKWNCGMCEGSVRSNGKIIMCNCGSVKGRVSKEYLDRNFDKVKGYDL